MALPYTPYDMGSDAEADSHLVLAADPDREQPAQAWVKDRALAQVQRS